MMYTSRRPSPFCLSTYAALTLLVPAMVLLRGEPETAPRSRAPIVCASPEVSARVAREPAVSSTPARERVIEGLWQRYDGVADGDPMRFYYFHDGAHGLYRYGKVGYTNTHGFNYAADGSSLTLRFRKSGERHEVTYRVEREGGRDWLVLEDDPREPGATRYFRVARGGQALARNRQLALPQKISVCCHPVRARTPFARPPSLVSKYLGGFGGQRPPAGRPRQRAKPQCCPGLRLPLPLSPQQPDSSHEPYRQDRDR